MITTVPHASVLLCTIDRVGTCAALHGTELPCVGLRAEDLRGRSVFEALAEAPEILGLFERALTGEAVSWRGNLAGGVVEVLMLPRSDDAGAVVGAYAVWLDVTERVLDERSQAEGARRQLAALVESSGEPITGTDMDGRITSWNRAAEQLYGYTADEVLGRGVELLLFPEQHSEEASIRARLHRGEPIAPHETKRRRKDGSSVEISLAVWPVHDPSGHVIGTGRLACDLTEARKTDSLLRRSREQLLQAQKMEAVGNLAGGVAHDFNNFLSLILTFSSLALENLEPQSPAYADVKHVVGAAQKAAALTRQLLIFSSQEVVSPQVVDLKERVAGLNLMLSRLLGENIRLKSSAQPDLWAVYADPGQIDQVIMNLSLNARDAMPDGGRLIIATANATLEGEYVAAHPDAAPGQYVVLAISDEGIGMPPEVASRIFEPFFTTKPKGKGTGLGLSTVFGIVKQLGGHISVNSEVGTGTTIKVYLPRSERPVGRPSLPSQPPSVLSGTETVMVVEDDDTLRSALRTVLAKHGYRVLEAQNGPEALMISEQFRLPVHLLVTDLVLPRMSGLELVARLRVERPALKILLVSGYGERALTEAGSPAFPYLAKPVAPDALLRKMREVLDLPVAVD